MVTAGTKAATANHAKLVDKYVEIYGNNYCGSAKLSEGQEMHFRTINDGILENNLSSLSKCKDGIRLIPEKIPEKL